MHAAQGLAVPVAWGCLETSEAREAREAGHRKALSLGEAKRERHGGNHIVGIYGAIIRKGL